MKTKERLLSFALLGILSIGLCFVLYMHIQLPSFSINDHAFHPPLAFMLVWAVAAYSLLVLFWLLLPRAEQAFLQTDLKRLQRWNLASCIPLALGLPAPLLLSYYLTADDLKTRLHLLTAAMLLGVLLLKAIQYRQVLKERRILDNVLDGISGLPRKKLMMLLFVTAFLLYHQGAALLVSRGLAFPGDEPYYLLTANSLYQDQDINLANDYAEGDHANFYPPELYPNLRLQAYARVGRHGSDTIYPINQPGVSVLILPWYALSQLFKGRALIFVLKSSLAFWAALLGIQLYLLFVQLWGSARLALSLWFIYAFTAPIFFYGFHVYPAVPIALFSVYIYRKARSPGPLPAAQYVFCGFLLALYPWFGLKYNMIMWPLLLVAGYHFVRDHKIRWKTMGFLLFPLISQLGFYLYVFELYGTFNPIAIYEGVLTPEKIQNFRDVMRDTPLMLRIDSFFDYFLDQRDGLLLYSPWYLFALLGLVEMFRRARTTLLTFALLAGPFLFNYAFFAHRQGSSPPGRVLAPLSWMGAIAVGYFILHNRKRLYGLMYRGAVFFSFAVVILMLHTPLHLYQPTTHQYTFRGAELFISLSNLHFYLPDLLPSFIKVDNLGYIPNYIWLGLILVFVIGYSLKRGIRIPRGNVFLGGLALGLLTLYFLGFCLYPRPVLMSPERIEFPSGERVAFYTLDQNVRRDGTGVFNLHAYGRTYNFFFTSRRPLKSLRLEIGPRQGSAPLRLEMFDLPLYEGRVSGEPQTIEVADPPSYRFKNTNLYLLRVTLRKPADESQRQHYVRLVFLPRD
jgi:hypothetical protein